jgi:hypothetical protein
LNKSFHKFGIETLRDEKSLEAFPILREYESMSETICLAVSKNGS